MNDKSHPSTASRPGNGDSPASSLYVLKKCLQPGVFMPLLAIFLQLVVIVAICCTLAIDVFLGDSYTSSIYDPTVQTGILAGLTIGGTIITTFTIGQLKSLWVKRNASQQDVDLSGHTTSTTRKTTVLIGLAGIVDQMKAAEVSLTLVMMGLVTTGLVAAPHPQTRSRLAGDCNDEPSVDLSDPKGNFGRIPQDWFSWTLDDGTRVTISDTGSCDVRTLDILDSEKPDNSETVVEAYRFNGISVDRTAVGAPLLDLSQQGRRWSEHCLPIFTRSPVSCKAAPSSLMTYQEDDTNRLTVTSSDGNCTIESLELTTRLQWEGASVAGACTFGQEVGSATILLGAINEHAELLELWLPQYFEDEPPLEKGVLKVQFRAIECRVDVRPVLGFRTVRYEAKLSPGEETSRAVVFVPDDKAGQVCTPRWENGTDVFMDKLVNAEVLGMAAAGAWQVLAENRDEDGWWETLSDRLPRGPEMLADGDRDDDILERTLADLSAISFARAMTTRSGRSGGYSLFGGRSGEERMRIGSGKFWTVVFILPSLFSIFVLGFFLFLSRRQRHH